MEDNNKRNINWEKIELDYRAGIKTLREIADEHGISHAAVNKRAKRDLWVRGSNSKEKLSGKVIVNNKSTDSLDRSGFVYVIYLDDSAKQRFYKIGMSSNFNNRFDAHQGSSPFDLCVACVYYVGNMREEESILHVIFKDKRVHGEWFDLNYDDLKFISSRSLLI